MALDSPYSLLGGVSSEMLLYVLFLGHAKINAMQIASLSESSGLSHPAPLPGHFPEHFLHVNR